MARLQIASGIGHVTAPAGTGAAGLRVRARGAGAAGGAGRRTAWRWGLLLAAGWLVQAGLRAWFGRLQTMPLANPDETAYLIAARVLAGGPGADLSGSTLYPGGYPLLITPVYWFTSDPGTVYHAVVMINSAVSALVMPLGYLACRRLGLDRPAAYGVAMVTAAAPAGFFYSQYAMADAIFPVVTLAWLLAVHSWLRAPARYAAAVGSALLTGYAYAVHSRGLVMLAGYAAVAVFIAWRRPWARLGVVAAGLTAIVTVAAGWSLDQHLRVLIYPEGTRSLSGQMGDRLTSVYGAIHVLEMAAGQLWRLTLDSWGIAGIGLVAAVFAAVRPESEPEGRLEGAPPAASGRQSLRVDVRIMAALSAAVTVVIACAAPAALPSDQSQTWASGRYLDGMIVTFSLVGAVVLLRSSTRRILGFAACAAGLFVLAAVIVAVYAGTSLPASGFGSAFNFAEPAVLTQDWNQASVPGATAVAFGLLLAWVVLALAGRRWRPAALAGVRGARVAGVRGARVAGVLGACVAGVLGACVAGVNLVAVTQMTGEVSRAGTVQARQTAIASGVDLRPGEQIAIAWNLGWQAWVPEVFQVWWTQLQSFHPYSQPPPAGVSVVEAPWPSGQPASASWPHPPAGWRIVASSSSGRWVVWRLSGGR